MIGTLLKLLAYSNAPRATFTVRHPVVRAQLAKTPFDFRTAYAPRIAAVATALIVGPLAYRVGKRVGEGALRDVALSPTDAGIDGAQPLP